MIGPANLLPGRNAHFASPSVRSVMEPGDEGAPYDKIARLYDHLVGSTLYKRVMWGTRPSDYAEFADEALSDGHGPLLDVGCGAATATAECYRRHPKRPALLVDRSLAMLKRAAQRIGSTPNIAFLHADLYDLPMQPQGFEVVGCFGTLHVLPQPWRALEHLAVQLTSGGRLYASMLVADRGGISLAYMRALQRRGELGPLRTAGDLHAAASAYFTDVSVSTQGAMAYLRATKR